MNIEPGLLIQHKWYDRQTDFKWQAEVLSVDEDNNELRVNVISESGVHPETWNLAHTRSGFNMNEYEAVRK